MCLKSKNMFLKSKNMCLKSNTENETCFLFLESKNMFLKSNHMFLKPKKRSYKLTLTLSRTRNAPVGSLLISLAPMPSQSSLSKLWAATNPKLTIDPVSGCDKLVNILGGSCPAAKRTSTPPAGIFSAVRDLISRTACKLTKLIITQAIIESQIVVD